MIDSSPGEPEGKLSKTYTDFSSLPMKDSVSTLPQVPSKYVLP